MRNKKVNKILPSIIIIITLIIFSLLVYTLYQKINLSNKNKELNNYLKEHQELTEEIEDLKNIKENYTIIKNILQTDIIELEKMYLRFNTKTNKTILEIYDEENMYNTLEIPNIEEPNVKQNKKIKVFI